MMRQYTARRTFIAAVACSAFLVSSAWGWYPYGERYNAWQKGRPVLLGGWMGGWALTNDRLPERIARYRAAGFSQVCFFKLNDWYDAGWVRTANEAGLPWIGGWRGGGDLEAMLNNAGDGASAILVLDEPNEREEDYALMEERIAWLHTKHPRLLAFANLSIVEIDHDKYVTRCNPDVFSYDHYPLQYDGGEHERFLYYMGLGRETCRKHRLPYWMVMQAYGRHLPDREAWRSLRLPGEADMRYQMFSFLAHGGTGMMFWMYCGILERDADWVRSMIEGDGIDHAPGMLAGNRNDEEKYRAGLRYEAMHPTRSYYALRSAAGEVQVLGRALLNLRTKDPLGYAGAVPEKCAAFEGHGALRSVANVRTADYPVLIGFFDDESGQEYFMVVNLVHGLNVSKMDGARTVRLTFGSEVKRIERLNRMSGLVESLRTKPDSNGTRILDLQLEGGTGDLFKWANG